MLNELSVLKAVYNKANGDESRFVILQAPMGGSVTAQAVGAIQDSMSPLPSSLVSLSSAT